MKTEHTASCLMQYSIIHREERHKSPFLLVDICCQDSGARQRVGAT